jgi:DNA-binding HxlR family transcriptional regulator
MSIPSCQQFCPVSMAAEILGSRWTIVLLRELCAGSTRFNDLRRGVPRMSPALLSKRLKELEGHGVIERRLVRKHPDIYDYVLTKAGQELKKVVMEVGVWGQRWVESDLSLKNTDPSLLMWDMRRNLNTPKLPPRRVTIQFIFSDQKSASKNFWILHDQNNGADLCSIDPGFDVDLFVRCDLRTLTAIWMGLDRVAKAIADERMFLSGDSDLSGAMQDWLGLSPFAATPKQVA